MPSIYNELGAFQFENLVQNRVPFLLINLETDLQGLFLSLYQNHLNAMTLPADEASAVERVRARKVPLETPLLLMCETGERSRSLVDVFEAEGFLNVYYFKQGLRGLRQEISPSR